jgi:hypothetical protein
MWTLILYTWTIDSVPARRTRRASSWLSGSKIVRAVSSSLLVKTFFAAVSCSVAAFCHWNRGKRAHRVHFCSNAGRLFSVTYSPTAALAELWRSLIRAGGCWPLHSFHIEERETETYDGERVCTLFTWEIFMFYVTGAFKSFIFYSALAMRK